MKFKVGDRVRLKEQGDFNPKGYEYVIREIEDGAHREEKGKYTGEKADVLELISSNQSNNMNIIQKAKLAITPEPEKSFIKAEIMNTDGTLTSEGQTVFLGYLLEKNKEAFKTDVVDQLLAEDKQ